MEIRRAKILRFTLWLAGIAFCAFGLWLLLGPAEYKAQVKIMNEPDVIADSGPFAATVNDPDFYFIKSASENIQSESVLTNVVLALNLNDVSGKKYTGRDKLETRRTVEWLKKRIKVQTASRTFHMTISATSEDPDEAAKIANAIAQSYREYRLNQRRQSMVRAVQVLTEQYQSEEEQIHMAQTKVESLRVACKITNDVAPPEMLREQANRSESHNFLPGQSYWDEKNKLDGMIEFHKLLKKKIESVKLDSTDSSPWVPPSMVEIIETAVPLKSPVGPDRVSGALLVAMGLFLSVGGFLLLKPSDRQPV